MRLGKWTKRLLIALMALLIVVGALGGAGYWLTREGNSPEFRVWYKRMKAPSPYTYDEIPERFLKVDPAPLISARSTPRIDEIRGRIISAIWGQGGMTERLPTVQVLDAPSARSVSGLPPLSLLERLEIPFEWDYAAVAYHFRPAEWNGRTVIYNHGYAGDIEQASPTIGALTQDGYAVVAIHFLGYGEVLLDGVDHPSFGPIHLDRDKILVFGENPLRYYIAPITVVMNHLEARHGQAQADAVGFSAGGWAVTVAASVDPRITTSTAVASLYPIYLRPFLRDFGEAPPPHVFPPLLEASNYLDMFVLAGAGEGRRYTQIFNRYDRCCYRNTFGKLYEDQVDAAVRQAGSGDFDVLIDETHADHKVSAWAIERLLARLGGAE